MANSFVPLPLLPSCCTNPPDLFRPEEIRTRAIQSSIYFRKNLRASSTSAVWTRRLKVCFYSQMMANWRSDSHIRVIRSTRNMKLHWIGPGTQHSPRNCSAEFFSTASEQNWDNFTPSRPRVCALCCNRESIGRFAACLKLLGTALNILSVFDSEIFGLPICRVGIGVHSQNASCGLWMGEPALGVAGASPSTVKLDGCNVLITGASAGIGREFARQVAGRARSVILVARRQDRLAELRDELQQQHPNLAVRIRQVDVADPAQLQELMEWFDRENINVDLLINNAGLGDSGPFATSDPIRNEQMTLVNVVALASLTRHVL